MFTHDEQFHTVVTVFSPDTERDGMEFDYVDELLSKEGNYELKIESVSSDTAIRETLPTVSEETLSMDIIPENGKKVNNNSKKQFSLSRDTVDDLFERLRNGEITKTKYKQRS